MIPDLIATVIAIALVCTAVVDRPLLDSQHWLLVVAGFVLAALGVIANRSDYLKWPGAATAASGVAIVILIVSGLSSASSETMFWIVFWSGNIAGVVSLWSALYRETRTAVEATEPS